MHSLPTRDTTWLKLPGKWIYNLSEGKFPMKRVAFLLKVKEDKIQEYKKHHEHVWPEMLQALRRTGWSNYSLFMREDGLLFGYFETPQDFPMITVYLLFQNLSLTRSTFLIWIYHQCEPFQYSLQPDKLVNITSSLHNPLRVLRFYYAR